MFMGTKQIFHWRRAFHKGRDFGYCRRLIAGVMMFTASAASVDAAPTGGDVTVGNASIVTTTHDMGTDTTIIQDSHRIDIDWTGFDTNQHETVYFDQASSDLAINRIGGNRTQFDGKLTADGTIFLINQNGITFGGTARVNVGSLLATTSGLIQDKDEFLQAQDGDLAHGSYRFGKSGDASIINHGDITVSQGGFAVLAAPYVENSGLIRADLGQVELVSTREFRIKVDFRGDGLITFDASQDLFEEDEIEIDGPLGVKNTGTLQARSGHVYLTTAKLSDIVESTINLDGVVDADQFVEDDNGDVAMIASGDGGHYRDYAGGTIKVASTGDINIGDDAYIHAIGGEQVTAIFHAEGDINMGAEGGDSAKITLKADSGTNDEDEFVTESDYGGRRSDDANAEAYLEMIAGYQGHGGDLSIVDSEIEVTATATAADEPMSGYDYYDSGYGGHGGGTSATAGARAVLQGDNVDIGADITVDASAKVTLRGDQENILRGVNAAECYDCDGHDMDGAEAVAVLGVSATGDDEAPGNLTLQGDINVNADAGTLNGESARSRASTVLIASGDVEITGDINVKSAASSADELGSYYVEPQLSTTTYGCQSGNCYGDSTPGAEADAELVMLGGVAVDIGLVHDLLDAIDGGKLEGFDSFDGFGDGGVSFTGDINVSAKADFGGVGAPSNGYGSYGYGSPSAAGTAEATALALIAGGGDVFINTDPVRVLAEANANYDTADSGFNTFNTNGSDGYGPMLETEAIAALGIVAGLGDIGGFEGIGGFGGFDGGEGDYGSDLTILGDVSATARESATVNGVPDPGMHDQFAFALTALLASGDITVRGADPLADADPAVVQERFSAWMACQAGYGCEADTGIDLEVLLAGLSKLLDLDTGSDDFNGHLAQLIIEAGGEIDIQPKSDNNVQPTGLFLDPIGPGWPGGKPLRFTADGQMLVATGADATRPPRITALDDDIEAAILAGGDPGKLLPPTASGGCVAAGRDAFTIGESDYYDRLISKSCESAK